MIFLYKTTEYTKNSSIGSLKWVTFIQHHPRVVDAYRFHQIRELDKHDGGLHAEPENKNQVNLKAHLFLVCVVIFRLKSRQWLLNDQLQI